MTILLPSLVTRALEALGGVLGTSDLQEYLDEADATALDRARRVLSGLRATAIQTCDDPQHEIDQVKRAWVRLIELRRAQARAEARPEATRTEEEALPWESSNGSERRNWSSVGGNSCEHPGPSAPWRSVGMWSPC